MPLQRIRTLLKENWIFYLAGAVFVLGVKLFYSQADADELKWILAPTSRWVSILSGISFEYMAHTGFVNHDIRFIIASSCSGIQFMLIAAATLIFSFVHRAGGADGTGHMAVGIRWTAFSVVSAYLFTILVNGLRIMLSIYIPGPLEMPGLDLGWLTPSSLHTLIGTVTYFSSLLVLYRLGDLLTERKTRTDFPTLKPHLFLVARCAPPLFWYFFIVLGIPFLNRAWQKDFKKFADYAVLVSVICLLLFFAYCLIFKIRHKKLS